MTTNTTDQNIEIEDFIAWAYGLFKGKPSRDDLGREVYVTTYQGAYGVAGYVLTVNGSPPRATIIIEPCTRFMIAMRQGEIVKGDGQLGGVRGRRYVEAVRFLRQLIDTSGDHYVEGGPAA